MREYYHKN